MEVSLGTVAEHLKVRLVDPPEHRLLGVTQLPVVGHPLGVLEIPAAAVTPVDPHRVGFAAYLEIGLRLPY